MRSRQAVAEQVEIEGKPAALLERHRHGLRAEEVDHRFVDREAGIRVDDFVARLEQREHGEEDDRLAARHHRDMLRPDLDAARPRDIRRDRLAQLGKALRRAVVRPAVVQRLFGRFDDVRRRGEIGLADFQVHHAAALRFERAGLHQHIEGRFDPDATHPFCQFHGIHAFVKYGTPLRSSTSTTRSSIATRSPKMRPVTRPPPSSVTIAV